MELPKPCSAGCIALDINLKEAGPKIGYSYLSESLFLYYYIHVPASISFRLKTRYHSWSCEFQIYKCSKCDKYLKSCSLVVSSRKLEMCCFLFDEGLNVGFRDIEYEGHIFYDPDVNWLEAYSVTSFLPSFRHSFPDFFCAACRFWTGFMYRVYMSLYIDKFQIMFEFHVVDQFLWSYMALELLQNLIIFKFSRIYCCVFRQLADFWFLSIF